MNERQWDSFWNREIEPLPGFLNSWEGFALHELALEAVTPVVAEIGAYRGRSTLCIASALKERRSGTLYTVDLFEDTYTWEGCKAPRPSRQALTDAVASAGLAEFVVIIAGDSRDAAVAARAPKGIGFLFVDGDHEYDAMAAEWNVWQPKLSDGCTIAFHDYRNPTVEDGPTRLCDELAARFASIRTCDRFLREPDATPGGLFIGFGLHS